MPTEYRQIPLAPLYEISKDGDIQKIDKETPIFPYPLGSNNVKLLVAGERKSFHVDKLIREVWDNVVTPKEQEAKLEETNADDVETQIPQREFKEESPKVASVKVIDKEEEKRILSLDCKKHYKMYLLHKQGYAKKDIAQLLANGNVGYVRNEIKKYDEDPTRATKYELK